MGSVPEELSRVGRIALGAAGIEIRVGERHTVAGKSLEYITQAVIAKSDLATDASYVRLTESIRYTSSYRARTAPRAPCDSSRAECYDWLAADFSAVVPFLAADLPPARFWAPFFDAFAKAQRFLLASMMRLRPAALSFRLAVFLAGAAPPANFLASAHRFRCAAAIRLRALALMVLRFGGAEDDSVSVAEPDKLARSSAICASMRTF